MYLIQLIQIEYFYLNIATVHLCTCSVYRFLFVLLTPVPTPPWSRGCPNKQNAVKHLVVSGSKELKPHFTRSMSSSFSSLKCWNHLCNGAGPAPARLLTTCTFIPKDVTARLITHTQRSSIVWKVCRHVHSTRWLTYGACPDRGIN